jgi:TolB-like protein/class 3 adenylate cyclase
MRWRPGERPAVNAGRAPRMRPAGEGGDLAARVERRLAAILAADVVGYSSLMERDEDRTLARLKAHRKELIEPLIAELQGRTVKLMGDGALVEFASVVDAARCAVLIQRSMAEREAEVPDDQRIRLRIGINLGDVIHEADGDLYGDGVNIAARLEQLAEPGGVLVSGTAYDHLQGKLDLPLEFEGEQRLKNISRPVRIYRVRLEGVHAASPPPRVRRRGWMLPAAITVLLALLAAGIWRLWPYEPPTARPAVAVLPFNNLGGDETTGRLANGITEDVIIDLARFRDLDLIAHNSTEVYKGKAVDVRQVGRELNVGYVLEGSIQRQADRVRITAQLIDTGTGGHLWSERWDRPVEDMFAVQGEVAEWVANKLAAYGVLTEAGIAVAKRKRPRDLGAYDLYLLGTAARHRNTKEGVEEALRLLTRAVEIDPTLARAWVGLAWTYGWTEHFGADPATARQGREVAARRALELDPMDAEAHAAMAVALGLQGKLAQAEAELDRALSLGPSVSPVLVNYIGWASTLGRPEKGAELVDRAIRLDPSYPLWVATSFAYAYLMVGRYEDALRIIGRIPSESLRKNDLVYRAMSLAALGRADQARAVVGEALARFPNLSIESYAVLDPSWSETERQRLIETMRAAGFPLCAKPEELAKLERPVRLPECTQAEVAK